MLYQYAGHLFPLILTYIYVCLSSLPIIVFHLNINLNKLNMRLMPTYIYRTTRELIGYFSHYTQLNIVSSS